MASVSIDDLTNDRTKVLETARKEVVVLSDGSRDVAILFPLLKTADQRREAWRRFEAIGDKIARDLAASLEAEGRTIDEFLEEALAR